MSTTTAPTPIDTLRESVSQLVIEVSKRASHISNHPARDVVYVMTGYRAVKSAIFVNVGAFHRITAFGLVELKRQRDIVAPLGFEGIKRIPGMELQRIKDTLEALLRADVETFGRAI